MAEVSYLTEIDYPNFSAGFSQSLKDIIDDINDNFEKLMAKPFLKGDDGEGVVYSDETVYESNGNFTTFGKILIGVLFDIDDTSNINTLDNLKAVTKIKSTKDGNPQTSITAVDKWPTDSALTIKCATVDNKKYIFPPYYFIDSRLNDLKELTDDSKSDFEDFSCYIAGDYDGAWHLYKKQIMPTLYYDSDIDEFCWLINDDKTGITAQGIKGDKGDSINIWICLGEIYNGVLKIDYIFNESGQQQEENNDIKVGDLIICYFNEASGPQYVNDVIFGVAQRTDTYAFIPYDDTYELSNIYNNITLPALLNTIGTSNVTSRGLWFNTDNNKIEIFAKNGNDIFLGEVSDSNKIGTSSLTPSESQKNLNIYNPTKIGNATKNISISGNEIQFINTSASQHPANINNIYSKIGGNCTIYHTTPISISSDDLNKYQFLSGKFINTIDLQEYHNTILWQKIGNIVHCNGKISVNSSNEMIDYEDFINTEVLNLLVFNFPLNNIISTGNQSKQNKTDIYYIDELTEQQIYENELLPGTASIIFASDIRALNANVTCRYNSINSIPLSIYKIRTDNIDLFYFSNYYNDPTLNDCLVSHIQYSFSYLLDDDVTQYNTYSSNIVTNPGGGGSSQGGGSAS